MHVRVVRFTDVNADRFNQLVADIEAADGPPPGVPTTSLKMMFDQDQGTAVVLQYFNTAEDMETGAKAFSAMDPSETPGHPSVGRHVRNEARARRALTAPSDPGAQRRGSGLAPPVIPRDGRF